MQQDNSLEEIAQDPLAIFDWVTERVLRPFKENPALAERYQTHAETFAGLRSRLGAEPSKTDQYVMVMGYMTMVAQRFGGDVPRIVQIMRETIDKMEGKYN